MRSKFDLIEFNRVSELDDILTVVALAKRIWREHYADIITSAQIDYMLDKFQSANAVSNDICQNDYEYLLFYYCGEPAGYAAFRREIKHIFLSKIYVSKAYRQKGISRKFIQLLSDICLADKLEGIYLTVNKNNNIALKAYAALGFSTAKPKVTDIGGGFVMDDYVMYKPIKIV